MTTRMPKGAARDHEPSITIVLLAVLGMFLIGGMLLVLAVPTRLVLALLRGLLALSGWVGLKGCDAMARLRRVLR